MLYVTCMSDLIHVKRKCLWGLKKFSILDEKNTLRVTKQYLAISIGKMSVQCF